ncbi:MFS transporter [Nitratifractor sp.]
MKKIDRNIVALGFVSLFTDLASSMVTTILPLYIVYILHDGVDKLGFVVAVATFVSYGARFLFGYLGDRYGIVKPFVVGGYLLSAVTKPLLAFTHSWQSVALLRGAERLGKAIRSASKDSLISAYSDGRSGRAFGFHKTMDIGGELLGSLLVLGALMLYGQGEEVFRALFLATLLPGLLAVFIVIFFVRDVPRKVRKRGPFSLREDAALLPTLLLYFAVVFFLFNDSYYMIAAKEAGWNMAAIPMLVIALNLTQTLTSYPVGLWIDRYGSGRILLLAYLFAPLSLGALMLGWTLVAYLLLGLFTVGSLNALRSHISTQAKNRGSVYGIFYAGVAIAGSLGAMITGVLWEHLGQNYAYLFSLSGLALSILIAAVVMLLMPKV